MREIRTLRAMWRALETGLRQFLNGHEEGNLGYKPRKSLRAAAPVLDPTRRHLRGETAAIVEVLAHRVQHAIRVIASTSLGCPRVIARSSTPDVTAVADAVLASHRAVTFCFSHSASNGHVANEMRSHVS